jgi:hypothetical protein
MYIQYIQYAPKHMCRSFYIYTHMYTTPETNYQNFKNLGVNLSRMNTIVPSSAAKLHTSVAFPGYGTKVLTSASTSLPYPHSSDHFHLYREPRRNSYRQNTIHDQPTVLTEDMLYRCHAVIVPTS